MLALSEGPPFAVHLDNFEGPFDLLLGLIAKHKLDVTEVALARVTDEFLAHVKALVAEGSAFPLGQASEFLVVAATLLDLKAARLLPRGEVDDEEDLALLEARDLLFARLLQYRAYKAVSALFSELADAESRHVPRTVPLEERFARALPELQLSITPDALAALAHRLREPAPAAAGGDRPRARPAGGRPRARPRRRRAAARTRGHDVSGAVRGLPADAGGGCPLPGAPGAVSRGARRVRAGHAAGGADRTVGG